MKHKKSPLPATPQRQKNIWFSWWVLAGIGVIIFCAATFVVLNTAEQQKEQMLANMKDRADVLIWAIEGSARSMGPMQQRPLLALVEEVAKQPRIAYIAVISNTGQVLVHSDPAQVGSTLYGSGEMQELHVDKVSQARFSLMENRKILEVYKEFTPSQFYGHGARGQNNGGMGHWRTMPQADNASDSIILVGIDASRFDEKLQEHIQRTTLISALITLAGFMGVALLFYIQNYKYSQRMLEDTQALATQVVSSLPVGLIVTDLHGKISLYNQHGKNMLRLNTESESQSLHDVPALDWQSLMDELDANIPVLERNTDLFISKTKPLPISLSATRITDSAGGFSGYLFILRDLGEVRRLQKQIKQNERLSALGNLAAGVAHEIRNPLSSIKGYATYLTEKLKDDKMAHATGMILIQETERLNRVVSDLLSVAKPLTLNPQPVIIAELLQKAVRIIMPDAEEKGVTVELVCPLDKEQLERSVRLDADRFIQAILNLLVNAVQATDSGGTIRVMLEEIQTEEGMDSISVSVSDTGCGMSSQTLANLFTPYFTTKASGTGLGLTLTQQIIEQHGGEMKVYSQLGKGSAFTMLLPFANNKRSQI